MTATRLLAAALVVGLAGSAAAQAPVDEHKRALARELIALSGTEATTRQVIEVSLAQLEPIYTSVLEEVLSSEKDLSEQDKRTLRSHLADYEGFSKEFRARFAERIDVSALIERVYVPLYDANFSTQELEQMVAFYRTPTGRKLVKVLPRVHQEGIQHLMPLIQPEVMTLVGEILARRRSELFH